MSIQQLTITSESTKPERLEFRVPLKLKILLQHAASIQGRTLSDFLTSTAEKAANEVIRENQIIQLSVEDSLSFAKALLTSSKPNRTLQTTYSRYKKNVSSK